MAYIGYYNSETKSWEIIEEQEMTGKIEIDVKVNGKKVPLHEVSEQTLLAIRENSKSKPVPAFQVCNFWAGKRLIFKVTEAIAQRVGEYVMLNSNGGYCNSGNTIEKLLQGVNYGKLRELKLEEL